MLNKIKKRIKDSLLIKLAKQKKLNNLYEKKFIDNIKLEQSYIDKINLLEDELRQMSLKLSKEDRECWLKERNKNEKRNTPKKK